MLANLIEVLHPPRLIQEIHPFLVLPPILRSARHKHILPQHLLKALPFNQILLITHQNNQSHHPRPIREGYSPLVVLRRLGEEFSNQDDGGERLVLDLVVLLQGEKLLDSEGDHGRVGEDLQAGRAFVGELLAGFRAGHKRIYW